VEYLCANQRTAQVEDGIAVTVLRGIHGSGQHDGLARDILQVSGGPDHGVRAMGDDHALAGDRCHGPVDGLPVLVGQVQAVLLHDGDDLVVDDDIGPLQDASSLWLADMVLVLDVEVGLVDRTAGGENDYAHRVGWSNVTWRIRQLPGLIKPVSAPTHGMAVFLLEWAFQQSNAC